jgi:hypothetical protein
MRGLSSQFVFEFVHAQQSLGMHAQYKLTSSFYLLYKNFKKKIIDCMPSDWQTAPAWVLCL